MDRLIGVDLGGTHIVCGLVDTQGQVLQILKRPTEAASGSTSILDKIAGMIEELVRESGTNPASLQAVGIGVPGNVNPQQGISLSSANLGWRNVPVMEILRNKIGRPVYIDNDVRMYVYGEAMRGAGCGCRHVLGVIIGTGVAGALVHDGRLYYGGDFLAGEIGHIPIEGLGEPCKCGGIGCLETVVSAHGIGRLARRMIDAGNPSILSERTTDMSMLTSLDISKAFDQGDEVARQAFEQAGTYLAHTLSYVVPLVSPDVIVIGGGVALAGHRLLEPLQRELQRRIRPVYWNRMSIRTAQWNDEAGVIGSALYAQQRLRPTSSNH